MAYKPGIIKHIIANNLGLYPYLLASRSSINVGRCAGYYEHRLEILGT